MTTEEMIKEHEPVAMELEYVEGLDKGLFDADPAIHEEEAEETRSKKEQIISLFKSGTTDIARIVRLVSARPSYVAQVLQNEGLISGYFDLYTTTAREQNIYSRFFRNVLSFKTVEAASESVRRIDRLYNYFERLGDRAGQHQAMVLALTGKNRARWSGKKEEAEVFSEWLAAH
jgi:predicted HTH domain antitoxin